MTPATDRRATVLELIRSECAGRDLGPSDLQRRSGVAYRVAWTVLRGDSSSISWGNLELILRALGIRVTPRRRRKS